MTGRALRSMVVMKQLLARVGSLRDGLLVAGAIVYGAGYAAWSLHASMHGLGPVSGLEVQYFIAGVPVLLVLGIGWYIGRVLVKFCTTQWPAWYTQRSRVLQRIVT